MLFQCQELQARHPLPFLLGAQRLPFLFAFHCCACSCLSGCPLALCRSEGCLTALCKTIFFRRFIAPSHFSKALAATDSTWVWFDFTWALVLLLTLSSHSLCGETKVCSTDNHRSHQNKNWKLLFIYFAD